MFPNRTVPVPSPSRTVPTVPDHAPRTVPTVAPAAIRLRPPCTECNPCTEARSEGSRLSRADDVPVPCNVPSALPHTTGPMQDVTQAYLSVPYPLLPSPYRTGPAPLRVPYRTVPNRTGPDPGLPLGPMHVPHGEAYMECTGHVHVSSGFHGLVRAFGSCTLPVPYRVPTVPFPYRTLPYRTMLPVPKLYPPCSLPSRSLFPYRTVSYRTLPYRTV